jgi:hypothetical protein
MASKMNKGRAREAIFVRCSSCMEKAREEIARRTKVMSRRDELRFPHLRPMTDASVRGAVSKIQRQAYLPDGERENEVTEKAGRWMDHNGRVWEFAVVAKMTEQAEVKL